MYNLKIEDGHLIISIEIDFDQYTEKACREGLNDFGITGKLQDDITEMMKDESFIREN